MDMCEGVQSWDIQLYLFCICLLLFGGNDAGVLCIRKRGDTVAKGLGGMWLVLKGVWVRPGGCM